MAQKRKINMDDIVEQEVREFKRKLLKRLRDDGSDVESSPDSALSDSDSAVKPKTSATKLKGPHRVRSTTRRPKHFLDSDDQYTTDEEKAVDVADESDETQVVSKKGQSVITITKLEAKSHGVDEETFNLLSKEYESQFVQVRQIQSELDSKDLEINRLKEELEQTKRTLNEVLEEMTGNHGTRGLITLD